jgi:hypothetical protein
LLSNQWWVLATFSTMAEVDAERAAAVAQRAFRAVADHDRRQRGAVRPYLL